ncbi:MAG TPA: folylpolyglutamate synthase/dihydrofolate synthase family protein [Bacteroidia bacterium]|nr:folylpolyglutamate synthase/dihydrofolate synthase family protein [Bacteroidia bacterium]
MNSPRLVNYAASIDWLYGTQTFGIKLGLENTRRLLSALGIDPDEPGPAILHVAGTNGKGSVCAVAERILRDAGIRTGLFTSPHLVTYRERIRVDGTMISEEAVADGLSLLCDCVSDWETHPTFFEISLALAMRHFRDAGCEAAVLETGMGGRLDATNALRPAVSVITSISLDHQQWLGGTIREIAAEKAGILKPGVPVIVGDLHPDARDVVGRRALALGIPCLEAHSLPDDWTVGLKGPHQRENAALAVEAACRIDEKERLTREGIRRSVAEVHWPGRFQRIDTDLVLDGAHNPAAAAVLRQTWQDKFGEEKAHLVFGAVGSKDVSGIFAELLPILASVTFVPVKSERRLSVPEMKDALATAGGAALPQSEAETLSDAVAIARGHGGRTLVAGSLFLVGEALGHFLGGSFEVSLQ